MYSPPHTSYKIVNFPLMNQLLQVDLVSCVYHVLSPQPLWLTLPRPPPHTHTCTLPPWWAIEVPQRPVWALEACVGPVG